MMHLTSVPDNTRGWLDSLAIGMSLLCAVHCLLTPLALIALPLLASTFWVSEQFHLWMLLLVLPTTSLAVYTGWRKHHDRAVVLLSLGGMALLSGVVGYEMLFLIPEAHAAAHHCASCSGSGAEGHVHTAAHTWTNVAGGLMLATAHTRNFLLCRKADCCKNGTCKHS